MAANLDGQFMKDVSVRFFSFQNKKTIVIHVHRHVKFHVVNVNELVDAAHLTAFIIRFFLLLFVSCGS